MAQQLVLQDPSAVADVLTFARRAARLSDPAVRLRAASGTLALSAAPLSARGFGDDAPTILAMRFVGCDPELVCDLVVDAGALTAGEGAGVRLPDSGVSAAWAGISPPRAGWVPGGSVTSAQLSDVARTGIAAVADALPASAGEDIVRSIRAAVWGAPSPELGGIAAGAAFAADALGFLAGGSAEVARVFRIGTWTRLSMIRGQVLVRAGNPTGLTTVRQTGGR